MEAGTDARPIRVLYVARAPFVSGAERALVSMLRAVRGEAGWGDRGGGNAGGGNAGLKPSAWGGGEPGGGRQGPNAGSGAAWMPVQARVVLGHPTPLRATIEAMGIPVDVVAMPKRSKWGYLSWRRSVRTMERILDEFDAEVVHANDVPSCQAMSVAAGRRGLPRVAHVRWGIGAGELAWWCPGAGGGVEAVVCISDWVKRELGDISTTKLGRANLEVMRDCVDWTAPGVIDEHPPEAPPALPIVQGQRHSAAGQREAARPATGPSDTGERPSAVVLGFAGQLIASKGLDLVIEAMGMVRRSGAEALGLEPERRGSEAPGSAGVWLVVAGRDTQTGGAYERELRGLAERCGVADRVQWLGFVEDVSSVHRRVDAMVCPSRVEPLGLVPMEAARWSVPTMANRLGGFVETIEDGRTGWLVEPTPTGWAEGLRGLAAMKRNQPERWTTIGRAAHERARRLFSPMDYGRRMVGLYRGLIEAKTRSAAPRG